MSSPAPSSVSAAGGAEGAARWWRSPGANAPGVPKKARLTAPGRGARGSRGSGPLPLGRPPRGQAEPGTPFAGLGPTRRPRVRRVGVGERAPTRSQSLCWRRVRAPGGPLRRRGPSKRRPYLYSPPYCERRAGGRGRGPPRGGAWVGPARASRGLECQVAGGHTAPVLIVTVFMAAYFSLIQSITI